MQKKYSKRFNTENLILFLVFAMPLFYLLKGRINDFYMLFLVFGIPLVINGLYFKLGEVVITTKGLKIGKTLIKIENIKSILLFETDYSDNLLTAKLNEQRYLRVKYHLQSFGTDEKTIQLLLYEDYKSLEKDIKLWAEENSINFEFKTIINPMG